MHWFIMLFASNLSPCIILHKWISVSNHNSTITQKPFSVHWQQVLVLAVFMRWKHTGAIWTWDSRQERILQISLVRLMLWGTVPHKVQSLNKHYQETTDKIYLKSSLKSLAYNKIYTYKAVFLYKTPLIMNKTRNLNFTGSLFLMAVSEKEK